MPRYLRLLASLAISSAVASAQVPQAKAIVVHRYPAAALAPERLAPRSTPIVLGGSNGDGPLLFFDVVAAFLVGEDRLIVADGKTSEFRIFSYPGGRYLRSFGRRGQGPGEISDLWSAWHSSGTIMAEDAAGKVSLFSLEGKFLRSLPRATDPSGRRAARIGVVDDTISVAKVADELPAMEPGDSRLVQIQLVATSPKGSRVIGRFDDRILERGAVGRARELVFGAGSVAAVIGNRICVGYAARYTIDCYAPTGQHLTKTERNTVRAVAVTTAHREDYIASESTANLGPSNAAYVARLRSTIPYARSLPLFGEFVAAANGDLWVAPYVPAGPVPLKRDFPRQPTTWSVYGVDGRWKADVELPARFQLLSVSGARVIGVSRDDDDAESVVVMTLQKR